MSDNGLIVSRKGNTFRILACKDGTVGTGGDGSQFVYTSESHNDSMDTWSGAPININHESIGHYGKILGGEYTDGALYLDAKFDKKVVSYIEAGNYEGFSVGTIPTDVNLKSGEIKGYEADHLAVILIPHNPAEPETAGSAVRVASKKFEKTSMVLSNMIENKLEVNEVGENMSDEKVDEVVDEKVDEKVEEPEVNGEETVVAESQKSDDGVNEVEPESDVVVESNEVETIEELKRVISELREEIIVLQSFKDETIEDRRCALISKMSMSAEEAEGKTLEMLEFAYKVSSKMVGDEKADVPPEIAKENEVSKIDKEIVNRGW